MSGQAMWHVTLPHNLPIVYIVDVDPIYFQQF